MYCRRSPTSVILNENDGTVFVVQYRECFCFNIGISHCFLEWKIIRLIWIAFYKNKSNVSNNVNNKITRDCWDCWVAYLPKDIIKYMIKFIGNFKLTAKNESKCIKL